MNLLSRQVVKLYPLHPNYDTRVKSWRLKRGLWYHGSMTNDDHMTFAQSESAALLPTPWERWATRVEELLGFDLDGDQSTDGYSLDFAHISYERGMTPEAYAGSVKELRRDRALEKSATAIRKEVIDRVNVSARTIGTHPVDLLASVVRQLSATESAWEHSRAMSKEGC